MTQRETTSMLRRVGAGVRSGEVFRPDAAGVRLLLRALLFDGAGVPTWHALAACAVTDESVFFCESGVDPQRHLDRAKRVCASCPVRSECLEDALAWELPSARVGVRGGLSAAERQRLHLDRTAVAA